MSKDFRTNSLQNFLTDVLKLPYFSDVLKCCYTPGKSDLLVITGENATGKSFIRRILSAACNKTEIEAIPVSMELRTAGGIVSAFVFGSESYEATGDLSGKSVLGAISTSKAREKHHAIIWDEPDIGLSDNYAAGVGLEIKEFIEKAPKKLFFAAVATHRKVLIQQLLSCQPHHLRLGTDNYSLEDVISSPVTPKRLSQLREDSHGLYQRIQKLQDLKGRKQ